MMRHAAVAAALVVSAAVCVFGGVASAHPGTAAADSGLAVAINGAPFTSTPAQSLFAGTTLAPGTVTTAQLGLRNGESTPAELSADLVDLHDDDAGCTVRERRVDATCGPGGGELGSVLHVTVAVSDTRTGTYRTAWSGSIEQWRRQAGGVDAGRVGPLGQRWVRLTAILPTRTDVRLETDTVSFGLVITASQLDGSGVDAVHVGGLGVDAAAAHRGGGSDASLASTGVGISLLVLAGLLVLVAGGLLLVGGARRRRAAESEPSRL